MFLTPLHLQITNNIPLHAFASVEYVIGRAEGRSEVLVLLCSAVQLYFHNGCVLFRVRRARVSL